MYEINLDRYYDRFDDQPHYTDYKKMLFRAGDALQSAEMNEIQTTLKRDINYLAQRYLQNGEFVLDGKVITELVEQGEMAGVPLHDVIVKCNSGISFMNGDFINIEEGELTVPDQIVENSDFRIGIEILYETICSDEDETLKDPAVETINFKQAGACRLKITGRWILEDDYQNLDDTDFLPIFRIKQGDIYDRFEFDEENPGDKDNVINTFEKDVTNIVARYDRNANGNYLIEGYEIEFMERVPFQIAGEDTPEDVLDDLYEVDQLGPFNFSIADGNANVDGYNYQRDISQEIELEKLIDFELKQSEPINFTENGWYEVRHSPVRKVFRISGQKRIVMAEIQHGSFVGASDELPDNTQPVIEIEHVYANADMTGEYIKNESGVDGDYELDGDSIKWLPNMNEPNPGNMYFVTYKFQHTETEGGFEQFSGQILLESMVRDGNEPSDMLPSHTQPVLSIQNVFNSDQTTEYTKDVDYTLDGNSVFWLQAGNAPANGNTYLVNYTYDPIYTNGDVSVGVNGDQGVDDYSSVYLQGFAEDTTVNFDYDFVLKRIDVIFIDAAGKIGYVKGVPHEDDPRAPEVDKEFTLKIAEVLIGGDFDPVVTQSSQRVFKMSDVQLLLDAIRQNEYNITRMALQQNIQDTQPGANLKGQFVDTFDDDSKRDVGLESTIVEPEYRGFTIGGNLIMNISWETFNLESVITSGVEQLSVEMPPIHNNTPILSQPHVTKFRLINEYLFKSPPSAKITIKPAVYRWVTENHYRTFVRQVQSATRSVNSWTTRFRTFGTHRWHTIQKRTSTSSTSRQVLGSSVNRTASIQQSRRPAIIPRIRIQIQSERGDFNQSERVNIYMDKKYAGYLHASIAGQINGSFIVPSKVISGSKEVKAVGAISKVVGTTLFKAEPLSRTVQTTITNWWRWVVRRQGTIWREADPVAQSFIVNETMALDKIKIVFSKLPVTDVSCVVCETSAGFPDKNKAIISKTLSPSELNSLGHSQDFVFDNKSILSKGKEYAFIIICKDAVGAVQVARLGERTWDTPQQWMTGQAYSIGTLYNSSNNSAWTPIQEEDMRFWLYKCTFNEDYMFDFRLPYVDPNVAVPVVQEVSNATDLMIMANAKVYEGCNIKYKITLVDRDENDSAPREFLENAYSQLPLEKAYSGRVEICAVFNSNGLFTPVLDPNVQLAVGNSKKNSSYISTGFEFDYDVDSVTVLLDNYRPSNTNIVVSLQVFSDSTDADAYTWQAFTPDGYSTPLGNEWIESKFTFNWAQFKADDLANSTELVDTVQPQRITRVKIDLVTTNDKNRAVISNLRLNTINI